MQGNDNNHLLFIDIDDGAGAPRFAPTEDSK